MGIFSLTEGIISIMGIKPPLELETVIASLAEGEIKNTAAFAEATEN